MLNHLSFSSQINTAANHYNINILGGPQQEQVAHKASNYIAFQVFLAGYFGHYIKYRVS